MKTLSVVWLAPLIVGLQVACSSSGSSTRLDAGGSGAGGAATATGGATASGGGSNSGGASAGTGGAAGATSGPRSRVVGYLPNWNGSYADWATSVPFGQLTHLNLAFANAGVGNNVIDLAPSAEIDALVRAAHAAGVKVLPSLGGGSGSDGLCDHFVTSNVDAFVAAIDAFVDAHDFDGVDVDAESPGRMGSAYGTFIDKLEQRLAPKGKLLSAAVAQWIQGDMPDSALHTFDFVNVMSYDACGGWTGACPHSPYDQAVADLDFYVNDKQVPAAEVVLGVPFYGYCWGACDAGYHLYSEILSLYPNAWQMDWIDQGGAQWSYNGETTMASKARLGASHGGVMIWELSGDASGQRSLLGVISANL